MTGVQALLRAGNSRSRLSIAGLLLLAPLLQRLNGVSGEWPMSLAMTAGVKNLLGLLGFMAALSVCVLAERLYRRRSDARWIWLGASGLLTAGLQAAAVLRTDAGGLGSFLGQLIAFVALINAGLSASWYRKRLLGQAKNNGSISHHRTRVDLRRRRIAARAPAVGVADRSGAGGYRRITLAVWFSPHGRILAKRIGAGPDVGWRGAGGRRFE